MGEDGERTFVLEEAMRAQRVLREAAGMEPERFPVEAFVGMISDEIESLRGQGFSDEDVARVIRSGAEVEISAKEIASYYATPKERGRRDG